MIIAPAAPSGRVEIESFERRSTPSQYRMHRESLLGDFFCARRLLIVNPRIEPGVEQVDQKFMKINTNETSNTSAWVIV